MPTGYTAGVADGTVKDFPSFALQCARAFGALVEMRDEPSSAPIPEEFNPSEYAVRRVEDAKTSLEILMGTSDEDAAVLAEADYQQRLADRERRLQEKLATRARYEHMLAQARAWTPPSSEHMGMKEFMVEQLEQSVKFDCGEPGEELRYYDEPKRLSGPEWRAHKIEAAAKELLRAEEYLREERERAENRTQWVRQLRESLTNA